MLNLKPEIQNVHNTNSETSIITTVEKNRVVAHVYDFKAEIDTAVHEATVVRQVTKTWEALKPDLRSKASKALDVLSKTHTKAKAVLLHGSNDAYIEICPSNKHKEVLKELVDEAKYYGITAVEEQTEVTLSGPLAIWALTNLPTMCNQNSLEDNMKVKHKHVLVDNFDELYVQNFNNVLFKKLKEAGYNLPAVELKE